MPLSSFIKPWKGSVIRHLPALPGKRQPDPLNFNYCGKSNENRWNVSGEPTLYLASEKDVALAEFARHFESARTPALLKQIYKRKVYRFKIELDYTLDLCNPSICKQFSLTDAPMCFMDIKIARATATFLRNTTSIQAIFVPSMAFMDDASKWCLVIFLEKLQPNYSNFFKEVQPDGYFQIK